MRIEKIELHKIDDQLLKSYIDFKERTDRTYHSTEIPPDREFRESQARLPPGEVDKEIRYIALKDDLVVGIGNLMHRVVENDVNPDFCYFDIAVDPEHLREGIAKSLLQNLLVAAKSINKSKISIWTKSYFIAGNAWIKKLGIKPSLVEHKNRLLKENINYDYINPKLELLENELSKYRLEYYDKEKYYTRILEDDDFADLLVEYYNDVEKLIPLEDLSINTPIITVSDLRSQSETRIKQNIGNIRLFLYDKDQLIGSSGTIYSENKEIKAFGTGLTAVREIYHKQGIATYLKIKMLLHILDNFPHFTYLATENAQSNQAMIGINERLGFRKVYSWSEHEVQISVLEQIFE